MISGDFMISFEMKYLQGLLLEDAISNTATAGQC